MPAKCLWESVCSLYDDPRMFDPCETTALANFSHIHPEYRTCPTVLHVHRPHTDVFPWFLLHPNLQFLHSCSLESQIPFPIKPSLSFLLPPPSQWLLLLTLFKFYQTYTAFLSGLCPYLPEVYDPGLIMVPEEGEICNTINPVFNSKKKRKRFKTSSSTLSEVTQWLRVCKRFKSKFRGKPYYFNLRPNSSPSIIHLPKPGPRSLQVALNRSKNNILFVINVLNRPSSNYPQSEATILYSKIGQIIQHLYLMSLNRPKLANGNIISGRMHGIGFRKGFEKHSKAG